MNVILIDDHAPTRQKIRQLIEAEIPEIHIIAEAEGVQTGKQKNARRNGI